jgi:hypothetical protein
MSRKSMSGLLGIIVGGVWFFNNVKHFETQGFVAIGMPLLVFGLGIFYFVAGMKKERG